MGSTAVIGHAPLTGTLVGRKLEFQASGAWTAANADVIDQALTQHLPALAGCAVLSIGMARMTAFDTYGAVLLDRLVREAKARGLAPEIVDLNSRFATLYAAVERSSVAGVPVSPDAHSVIDGLAALGRSINGIGRDALGLFEMLGAIVAAIGRVAIHPPSLRLTSIVNQVDRVGLQAVPIILLITFLIGSIIAQQGFFHFRKFGADSYVVDMVGILVMREIGVLIVTIMVAGRSGSSYTAELGSMKMREEIDALRTMGFDPIEVLVVPRVLALVIALPLLTFLGSVAALYGAGLVAWGYGDMASEIFIVRLKEAITLTHFKVGMIKAPFMALVIGVVACAEGFKVEGSAESLGLRTTASVVKSIFMVIVLDGLFAMFFAAIGM
jgi:phospholipid/cholesterol/gamma-HCH transport system permease protein